MCNGLGLMGMSHQILSADDQSFWPEYLGLDCRPFCAVLHTTFRAYYFLALSVCVCRKERMRLTLIFSQLDSSRETCRSSLQYYAK